MFDELDRVKERRRERVERIRVQPRDSFSPFVEEWKDPIGVHPKPYDFSLKDDAPVQKRPLMKKQGSRYSFLCFWWAWRTSVFKPRSFQTHGKIRPAKS